MPSRGKSIRIIIADDHPLFRSGVRLLLESESDIRVMGEARDGVEAITLTQQLRPDVLLLDVTMPRMPGLEVLRQLAVLGLPVRTILVTAGISKAQAAEAMQLGARGLVLKESAAEALLACVRAVLEGETWIDRSTITDWKLLQDEPPAGKKFGLTPRELEIISEILSGSPNREIAAKFVISEDTVKRHLTNIYDKIGVSTRLELALFAISNNLGQR